MLQGSERAVGQDLRAQEVLVVLPAEERLPGRRSCWGLHGAGARGRVRARLWHGHSQPPAAVTAARFACCEVPCPLSGHCWAEGEKPWPDPLAAP